MKINPITKTYTTEYKQTYATYNNGLAGDRKANFCCDKTIVENTLKNKGIDYRGFGNTITSDVFVKSNENENIFSKNLIVKNTLKDNINAENRFLADMPLCDFYELPTHSAKNNVKNISFCGPFPQYLIDQDAVVEDYAVASNAINDIANSTYCSFVGNDQGENEDKNVLSKFCSFVKKILTV